MSKSKGNVVNPWEVIEKYGVDAVRWYFYTVNPPGETKNFDEAEVKKTLNKVINILYNSYVFYDTYADKKAISYKLKAKSSNVLDQWILARLNQTIEKATVELESYEVGGAAKTIESLIDDLSRWYIRRSRRRLQKPDPSADGKNDYEAASATLGHVLLEISKLMSPFAPFFSEALYQSLSQESRSKNQESSSVHLEDWPTVNKKAIDANLLTGMEWVRNTATVALAKRAEAGIKVRQPLSKLKIKNSRLRGQTKLKISEELLAILKDEINVKEVIFDSALSEELELDIKITPALREEGVVREFTRIIQELRQKAGLQPKDKIFAYIDAPDFAAILQSREDELKREIGATKLHLKHTEKTDAEISTKVDGSEALIGIKKV